MGLSHLEQHNYQSLKPLESMVSARLSFPEVLGFLHFNPIKEKKNQ